MYTTRKSIDYMISNAVNATMKLWPTEVLLDNQADVSILKPALLQNVEQADHMLKINGVSGEQMKVNT
jgi:hypothetical protein